MVQAVAALGLRRRRAVAGAAPPPLEARLGARVADAHAQGRAREPQRIAGARAHRAGAARVDHARAGVVLPVAELGRARVDGGVVVVAVLGWGEAVAVLVAALERQGAALLRDLTLGELRDHRTKGRDQRPGAAPAVAFRRERDRAAAERTSGVHQRGEPGPLPAGLVHLAEVVRQAGAQLQRLLQRRALLGGLADDHALHGPAGAQLEQDRGLPRLLPAAAGRAKATEESQANEPCRGGKAHEGSIVGAPSRRVKP